MDFVQQLIAASLKSTLPQGSTLKHVHPLADGRVDVIVSHGIEHLVSETGNLFIGALYQAARPVIDGALVASCGPVALMGKPRIVAPSTTKAVRRSAGGGRKRTDAGVEIVDAEFVDVPNNEGNAR